jgi:hypothetical protein
MNSLETTWCKLSLGRTSIQRVTMPGLTFLDIGSSPGVVGGPLSHSPSPSPSLYPTSSEYL